MRLPTLTPFIPLLELSSPKKTELHMNIEPQIPAWDAESYFAQRGWNLGYRRWGRNSKFFLVRPDGDPDEFIWAPTIELLLEEWEELARDSVGQWAMLERLKRYARSKGLAARESLPAYIERGPGAMSPQHWAKVTEAFDSATLDPLSIEREVASVRVSVKFSLFLDGGKYSALRAELNRCLTGVGRKQMGRSITKFRSSQSALEAVPVEWRRQQQTIAPRHSVLASSTLT
jgi:hypothetical protein